MRRPAASALLLALILAATATAGAADPVIAVLGDSLTAGFGLLPDEA
jgi:hypothetical protein